MANQRRPRKKRKTAWCVALSVLLVGVVWYGAFRLSVSRRLRKVKCLEDFDALAKAYLPGAIWEFGSTGAENNLSRAGNRQAFDDIWLQPRVLNDVSKRSIKCELLVVVRSS